MRACPLDVGMSVIERGHATIAERRALAAVKRMYSL
jgi:hypothetical protein